MSHTKSSIVKKEKEQLTQTKTIKDDEFCRVTIGKQRSIAHKCCLPKFPTRNPQEIPIVSTPRHIDSPMCLTHAAGIIPSGFHKKRDPQARWIVDFMEHRDDLGVALFEETTINSDLRVPKLRLLFHLNSAGFCPKTC